MSFAPVQRVENRLAYVGFAREHLQRGGEPRVKLIEQHGKLRGTEQDRAAHGLRPPEEAVLAAPY
jgi:hypothetical protein